MKKNERVKKFGEVMTPPKVVSQMLDILDEDSFENPDVVFFEPTCGDGAFVVQILERRMEAFYKQGRSIKESITLAVSNLWAIDVQLDNIDKCRKRAMDTVEKFLEKCLEGKKDGLVNERIFLQIIWHTIIYQIHQNEMITALCKTEDEARKKSKQTIVSRKWFDDGRWKPLEFSKGYLDKYL